MCKDRDALEMVQRRAARNVKMITDNPAVSLRC